jgi:hypothetical protein
VTIEEIAAQVQRNCRISDARAWGYYSICGLLLRLRELYKWEHGLEPWALAEKDLVMSWIGDREKEWEDLEDADLKPLEAAGKQFDPLDTTGVNALVEPLGFHYGAGYGMGYKPLFVLGRMDSRTSEDGVVIFVLGKELVRDLSPVPAMNRDGVVIARKDPMKWFLWHHLEDAGMKKDSSLAALAVAQDGRDLDTLLTDPSTAEEYFGELAERETAVAVHHEIGEIQEERRLEGAWDQAFSRSCGKKTELLARGLKDALADTGRGGRLAHIIGQRSAASLGLYAAFSEGLHRGLFPELGKVFLGLVDDGDWERVEAAREAAHRRLRGFTDPLFRLFDQDLAAEEAVRLADELEEKMLGRASG